MTESSAYLISAKLSAANKNAVMSNLFTTNGSGIGITFLVSRWEAVILPYPIITAIDDLTSGKRSYLGKL